MATQPKENIKVIAVLKKLILSGKTEIEPSDLEALGLDKSKMILTFGNIKLEKVSYFQPNHSIFLIDKQKDLDGNPISGNEALMTRIQTLWGAGKRNISNEDLLKFNVYPAAWAIEIGNVRLNSFLNFSKSYDFEIINPEKDVFGKWLDSAVTSKRVIETLLEFQFTEKHLEMTELALNKDLELFFKEHFKTVKKSDTSEKGLLDLSIGAGKNKVAIELKLANQLASTSKRNNCRSQIEDYHKQFGTNLILVVAGRKKDLEDKNVAACFEKAQELGIGQYKMMR